MSKVMQALAEVRRCSAKIEDCQRVISEIEYDIAMPSSPDGRHSTGVATDPVFSALVLIGDLRRIFCRKADVLEIYYVDRKTWAEVAESMGIAERTARTWRDELVAFIDSVPQLRIRVEQLGGFME